MDQTVSAYRIGIDLGGTKVAAILLDPQGASVWSGRTHTPKNDYDATIQAIAGLVREATEHSPTPPKVGVCIPGSLAPSTGCVQNANATWINGRPLGRDLEIAVNRPVRVANDANCFALSEWVDGAAAGADTVFGVIIGTGVGGGLVHHGRIVNGPMSTGGEWGHLPLPWPTADEFPGPLCWCGRRSCMEQWVSGPALEKDYAQRSGSKLSAREIITNRATDPIAEDVLTAYASRLARGLSMIVTLFDPDVVVLGGGLSNMSYLYDALPPLIKPHLFTSDPNVDIRPPKFGDASGVRGAAWLWERENTVI
ncbi:MAG: ROK family protein [Pseudomonadota bacterium]